MPKTSAAGRTDIADANLNPIAAGQVVQFNVIFDPGRTPNLAGLHDALVTLYGAGKVQYDKDSEARGCYCIRILA